MKHRYNPVAFIMLFVFFSAISLSVFFFFPDFVKEKSMGKNDLDIFLIVTPPGFTMVYIMESWGKKIETMSEYVKFHNFRFNLFGSLKTFSVTVSYESIVRLEAKKLPLVGIYKVIVTSKNYNNPIPVSMLFMKYKQLFSTLCIKTKTFNNEALIDDELVSFAEEYRNKNS